MDISVIIPAYNREQLIVRTIESVLAQTDLPAEVIVIDDGSTDYTAKVLDTFGSKIKIVHQEHSGVSKARNTGIQLANSPWLAFLDSDDVWLSQKLEQAKKFWQENPHYSIFQSEEIWIRGGRRVNPKRKHRKFGGWIFRKSLPLCIVSPSAVIVHRRVFEQVGVFDENFTVCEDYDLWLRIAAQFIIGLDNQALIEKYGGHADQLSRQYWGMDNFRLKAMEKHINNPYLTRVEKQSLFKEMQKKIQILIAGYQKNNRPIGHLLQQQSQIIKELEQQDFDGNTGIL
ncbi:MAG: glycosyltransferase [Caldithrix sp.]|nr:glycosyltransferase [Caldithrix sp.]